MRGTDAEDGAAGPQASDLSPLARGAPRFRAALWSLPSPQMPAQPPPPVNVVFWFLQTAAGCTVTGVGWGSGRGCAHDRPICGRRRQASLGLNAESRFAR